MTMRYGLVGEKLGHSWSKVIHESIADYTYDLFPLSKEEFHSFMQEKNFRGINVTIPYKQEVFPYLDIIDESAKNVGAVNAVVNREGKLYGYNTDYLGFLYTLEQHKISVTGKKCIVLGNGGASKAILAALKLQNAREIILVNRSLTFGVISYPECYEKHTDSDLIINTTPVGMFPNIDACPIDLKPFYNCKTVLDVIYNPLKTQLLCQAESLGMTAINGVEMLVAQAKYAAEYFLDCKFDDACMEKTVEMITKENFVLT